MKSDELLTAFRQGLLTIDQVQSGLRSLKSTGARQALSQGQASLLTLHRMQPESSAYNVPMCFRVSGPLNAEWLKIALASAVDRHPSLGNLFREEDGQLFQELHSGTIDVHPGHLDAIDDDALVQQLMLLTKSPFRLEDELPLRVHLLSHGIDKQILLIVFHHIAVDGQSVDSFLSALFNQYRALADAAPMSATASATSYAEFVEWEANLMSSEAGSRHLEYWRAQLREPLPVLDLPADHSHPADTGESSKTVAVPVEQGLFERARGFSAERRVNQAVLFLAVYQLLLHRYTSQDDVVIGMPVAGRPHQRFDDVVGYFVRTVAIRGSCDPDMRFDALLQRLQLNVLDALDHSAYPFPAVVRELRIPRLPGRSPVFQAEFVYQSRSIFQRCSFDLGQGMTATEMPGVHQEGEYEFVLEVREHQHACKLNFKYDARRFEAATVARMARHYLNLLESVIADPQRGQ